MIIGLTGSIASGKSESAKYFESLGAFCIDTDIVAKDLTCKDKPALQEITEVFGNAILSEQGSLDRKKLAGIIFSDFNAKLKLEKILHGRIISQIEEVISNKISEYKVIVINAPLLFETGLDRLCDKVVVVTLPYNIEVQRLKLRDELSDDEIKKRIESQMSLEEKVKRADFLVDNSGSKDDLKKHIENIYKLLTSNFE
ncbi:MAG: dephospho-CoA kinase [Endomicrobium sp.]|jgi:dephospho-CoA kinase|nr:dephospho-CoA kinase [Endomicrobium sp.]